MLNRVYCTYFDHNYLSRGLALYHSLQRHAPGCAALGAVPERSVSPDPGRRSICRDLVPVRLEDFEAADPELAATRSTRSIVEYYFTCTPAWMLYVLEREPDAEWVTYLDGDLYFFAVARSRSMTNWPTRRSRSSRIATPRNLAKRQVFGTYNVGWVGVRNDPDGIAVIKWWREKCIEWCHDYVDGDRFADQGYLDSFPRLSTRVKVIENVGANLAPWNIANYRIDFRDGRVMIDATQSADILPLSGPGRRACGGSSSTAIASSVRRFRQLSASTSTSPMSMNCWRSRRPSIRCSDVRREAAPPTAVIDIRQYLKSKVRERRHARVPAAGYRRPRRRVSCVSRHGVLA